MPGADSEDLRDKVMKASAQGEKKSDISQIFKLSRDPIERWRQRGAVTGTVQPVQGYQSGHSHWICDWDEFRAFAKIYADKTQAEMAQLWQGDISNRTISRALAHIGMSRKQRPKVTENVMQPNEPSK